MCQIALLNKVRRSPKSLTLSRSSWTGWMAGTRGGRILGPNRRVPQWGRLEAGSQPTCPLFGSSLKTAR